MKTWGFILMGFLAGFLISLVARSGEGPPVTAQEPQDQPSLSSTTVSIPTHVYDTPEAAKPLEPGNLVPAVPVYKVSGEQVNLAAEVNNGALLVFYRGGW